MQNYKKIALACALLLALAGGWYFFAGRNDVSDIQQRADAIRNELTNAESSQSRTAESLDRASDLAESAEGRAEKIEEGNRNLQGSERGDAEIITESQSILAAVRGRGKKEN